MIKIQTSIFNGEVICIAMNEEEAILAEKQYPNTAIYSPRELEFLHEQEPLCAHWLHEAKKQFPRCEIMLTAEDFKQKKKTSLREQLEERRKKKL